MVTRDAVVPHCNVLVADCDVVNDQRPGPRKGTKTSGAMSESTPCDTTSGEALAATLVVVESEEGPTRPVVVGPPVTLVVVVRTWGVVVVVVVVVAIELLVVVVVVDVTRATVLDVPGEVGVPGVVTVERAWRG